MPLLHRRTVAVVGTAAAVLGLGGTAFAVGSSTAPTPGTPSSTTAPAGQHHRQARVLRRLEHAQVVTRGKSGAVTHVLWRGTVTAVSSTSLTVKAADGASETYTVTKDTKVLRRTKGAKATSSTIGAVAKGDTVAVTGVGTPTPTAKRVVEVVR